MGLTPGPPLGRRARRPFYGKWSSQEAGIRASLLAGNPWFQQEAADVRRFLGLPGDRVKGVGTEEISEAYWYWRELGHIGPDLLGNLWEVTHASKAKGEAYSGLTAQLEQVRLHEGATECTLTLTIQGIDAFTPLEEVRRVWKELVEPAQRTWHLLARQVDFRERQGRFPDLVGYQQLKRRLPRRARLPFSKAKSYLPVLKLMNQGRSLGKALEELSSRGLCFDRRHAERGVKRPQELMKPWQVE